MTDQKEIGTKFFFRELIIAGAIGLLLETVLTFDTFHRNWSSK